jgi:surface polysaccharide O-acyltransferase-like enzyme
MLGVVLIHNVIIEPELASNQGLNVVAFIIELVSHQITSPCVPLFFFISGYLFFLKFGDKFGTGDYGTQLKKRVHSLLIPYIFWNLVVLVYFALLHKLFPSQINPEFNNVYQYTAVEWIRSFWDFPGGQPICYQFWFLRDLMLAVIISPIILMVMKYGRWYLMMLLMALYIGNSTLFPYQMMLTFFSLGVGFAIHRYDFIAVASKWVIPSAIVFVALTIISSLNSEMLVSNGLNVIAGSVVFVWIASKLKPINEKLAECGFFIYAFHGFPMLIMSRLIVSMLHPNSTIVWLGCYIGCFAVIVLLSVVLYFVLKRFLPKFTSIITGGR